MTGTSRTGLFWADLAEALHDPEFREAFMEKLREMSEDGNDS
jgi:hypothetical protein